MLTLRKKYQNLLTLALLVLLLISFLCIFFWFYSYKISIRIESTEQSSVDTDGQRRLETTSPQRFLQDEEVIVVSNESATGTEELVLQIENTLFEYVEVTDGCGPHFEGECLLVRGGPGITFPVVARLRNGMVLKIDGKVEHDGVAWYKIVFDEWLRYPERVKSDWYVAADFVKILLDEGDKTVWDKGRVHSSSTKQIIVNRTEQKLYAYDGETLFMEISISTGLELTPTPEGTFTIFKKTPSRYMQGPLPNIPGYQYYDLPGVPWNLYFTHDGAVIHGAYWHNSFGSPYSHGCVNLSPENANTLYTWAELGTNVIVKD